MTPSIETNNQEIRRGLFTSILAAGALVALAKKATKSEVAMAMGDGAAVAAEIKLQAAAIIKVYNEKAALANNLLDKARSSLDYLKIGQEAKDFIENQEATINALFTSFWKVGKDPMGAHLPQIQIEHRDIFSKFENRVKNLESIRDTISKRPDASPSKLASISKYAEHDLKSKYSSNDLTGVRKNINALSKMAGSANHKLKSPGQIFTEQSGPIALEQNQIIADTLLRIEQLLLDLYGRQYIEGFTPSGSKSETSISNITNEISKNYSQKKGTTSSNLGSK